MPVIVPNLIAFSQTMYRKCYKNSKQLYPHTMLWQKREISARWKMWLTAGQTSGNAEVAASANGVVRLSASGLALELLKQRGVFGLYKGFGATAARDVTFSVIYFPLFANLNALVSRQYTHTDIGASGQIIWRFSGQGRGKIRGLIWWAPRMGL